MTSSQTVHKTQTNKTKHKIFEQIVNKWKKISLNLVLDTIK